MRVLVVVCLLATSCSTFAVGPQFEGGQQVGTVGHSLILEASGIAASRQNGGVLWVHNDSGGSARVFAMDVQGQDLGQYTITGASNRDWEDMAIGPGPVGGQDYLYLGDIGDNNADYGSIVIYRVAEPAVSSTQAPVTVDLSGADTITLTYPDGARDAETLMVDPVNGDLYVVSKGESHSRVYRVAASQLVNGATVAMEYKAQLPWGWATGGDISPDGQEIIIRGYVVASLWTRPGGGDLWDAFAGPAVSIPLVADGQGEAIGFDADGLGYYTVAEGASAPIYYFARVPEPATLGLLVVGGLGLIRLRCPQGDHRQVGR